MKNNLFRAATLAAALYTTPGFAAHAQAAHQNHEQTNFSAEEEGVRNPVVIPAQVMSILGSDDRVHDELKYDNIAPDKLPSSWFSASQISLGPSGPKDLIVVAEPPLNGANIVTFWIFIQVNGQYKLALITRAHDLFVEKRHSHGYRNITASAETCCRLTTVHFQFNGSEYKKSSEKTEDIK
jgi:hypothetical protein